MIKNLKNFCAQGLTRSGFETTLIALIFFALPLMVSPWFNDMYTVVKWKAVRIFSLLALVQLLFAGKKLTLPSLGRPFAYTLIAIFALWGWEHYFHRIPLMSHVTVDRFGFLVLTLFFYRTFSERPEVLRTVGHALMASMGIFIIAAFATKTIVPEDFMTMATRKKFEFTFGNQNMAAVFFGVTFLCALRQIYLSAAGRAKYLYGALSFIFLVMLLKTGCRSVTMGVMAGAGYYALMRSSFKHRRTLMATLIAVVLGALAISPSLRQKTFNHRAEMIQSAVHMAKDYPLGIGRNKFNFYHLLYQSEDDVSPRAEHIVQTSPHTEPLKYLVEEGVPFVGLVLILLFFFWRRCGTELMQAFRTHERMQFAGGVLLLLGAEFFFQFPFDVAFPFLMITCVLGFVLAHLKSSHAINLSILVKTPLLCVYAAGVAILLMSGLARGLKKDDYAFTKRACDLAPFEWRSCNAHMRNASLGNQPKELLGYSMRGLETRPYNTASILSIARAFAQTAYYRESCRFLHFYDRLFYHRSHIHALVVKRCPVEDAKAELQMPLRDHYKSLFKGLTPENQTKLFHIL